MGLEPVRSPLHLIRSGHHSGCASRSSSTRASTPAGVWCGHECGREDRPDGTRGGASAALALVLADHGLSGEPVHDWGMSVSVGASLMQVVARWFQLEGGMLHVKVPDQAALELVE